MKKNNYYYSPATIPAAIKANKNRKDVKKRLRLAKNGVSISQVSTKAPEPIQSAKFKSGK